MKNFIDNVAVRVVEGSLMEGLGDILSPSLILQMEPNIVRKIAAESLESQVRRNDLTRKSSVLKLGLKTCKNYVGYSASSKLS